MVNENKKRIELSSGWKIQSSSKIEENGTVISQAGFTDSEWYNTSVPRTVFAALVDNGLFKDPYYGMNLREVPGVEYRIGGQYANMEMPENSPYSEPWWYRVEFGSLDVAPDQHISLHFRGINYRANIWMNGKLIADDHTVCGTFRIYEFDITEYLVRDGKNALAVEVTAPKALELGIAWVDWNPTPPDKNMGLWQEVYLTTSGPVQLRLPNVESEIDKVSYREARLSLSCEVKNALPVETKGVLKARITGSENVISISRPVNIPSRSSLTITFNPEEESGLIIEDPALWWPYRMGEPYLHKLRFSFELADGSISDEETIEFGIRKITSEIGENENLILSVNGKKVLIQGGGWAPDMLLRVDEKRREAEFRYVKEMGLNTIRLEGKLEDESFISRADKEGIMLIAGWCCCDAWERWDKWGEENRVVSGESLRDQLTRLRWHPSVIMWMNGSDNPPPADIERMYLKIEDEAKWSTPVVSSATAKVSEVSGKTGVKMTGPYDYVPPVYWYEATAVGGARSFNTETGPGPAVPPLEELRTFIPEDRIWPINEYWKFHAGSGIFKDIDRFTNAMNHRYGEAESAEEFTWKSQIMAYEGERAMFEAYVGKRYVSTGVIQWMLNNAWPGIIWHLYSYNLLPAGGYFGTKKATEGIHAQYSYSDRKVLVTNQTMMSHKGLKLTSRVFDLDLKEKFSDEKFVNMEADQVLEALEIPENSNLTSVYFLKLELSTKEGGVLSDNFYWLSSARDTLNYGQTEFYYTPQEGYADFNKLSALPEARLESSMSVKKSDEEDSAEIWVKNTGHTLAFMVRLRVLENAGGREITPVFWEENYFSLLPGESKKVSVQFKRPEGSEPVLSVDAFNSPKKFVN